jgi:hypothetical protein
MSMGRFATVALVALGLLPLAPADGAEPPQRRTSFILCGDDPCPKPRENEILLAAARAWRRAHDERRAVQPALYQALDPHGCGLLAPVFASLLTLFESRIGGRMRVAADGAAGLSADEQELLGLFDASRIRPLAAGDAAGPRRFGLMRIAVHSTRLMMQLVLRPAADDPSCADDQAEGDEAGLPPGPTGPDEDGLGGDERSSAPARYAADIEALAVAAG